MLVGGGGGGGGGGTTGGKGGFDGNIMQIHMHSLQEVSKL